MRFYETLRAGTRRQGNPVTTGIVALLIVFTVFWFITNKEYTSYLAVSYGSFARPWTLLSYTFVYPVGDAIGVVWFVIIISWILWLGGSVERDLGSLKFAAVWVVASIVSALFMMLGARIALVPFGALNPIAPLCNLMVMWGFRNRTAQVMIFGMLQVSGFWMGLLAFIMMLVEYGNSSPLIGGFACLSLPISYAFARDWIPGVPYAPMVTKAKPSKAQIKKEETFFDDVRKREQERSERERLRKLFENSMKDDE